MTSEISSFENRVPFEARALVANLLSRLTEANVEWSATFDGASYDRAWTSTSKQMTLDHETIKA